MVAIRTRDPECIKRMWAALGKTAECDKIYARVGEDTPTHKDGHSIVVWQRSMDMPMIYSSRKPIWETNFVFPNLRSDEGEIFALMHVRQDWFNAALGKINLPLHFAIPKFTVKAGELNTSLIHKYAITNGAVFTGQEGSLKLDMGYNCMVLQIDREKQEAKIDYLSTNIIFRKGKTREQYRAKLLYYKLYRAEEEDGSVIVGSSSVMENADITKGRRREVELLRRLRL